MALRNIEIVGVKKRRKDMVSQVPPTCMRDTVDHVYSWCDPAGS